MLNRSHQIFRIGRRVKGIAIRPSKPSRVFIVDWFRLAVTGPTGFLRDAAESRRRTRKLTTEIRRCRRRRVRRWFRCWRRPRWRGARRAAAALDGEARFSPPGTFQIQVNTCIQSQSSVREYVFNVFLFRFQRRQSYITDVVPGEAFWWTRGPTGAAIWRTSLKCNVMLDSGPLAPYYKNSVIIKTLFTFFNGPVKRRLKTLSKSLVLTFEMSWQFHWVMRTVMSSSVVQFSLLEHDPSAIFKQERGCLLVR